MPYDIGPNSKPAPNLGTLDRVLSDRDHLPIDEVVEPSVSPTGFQTRRIDAGVLADYILDEIRDQETDQLVDVDNQTLTQNSLDDQTIHLSQDWLNSNYVPIHFNPFSQVGDASDFALPISGSYFSVSQADTAPGIPPVVFSEPNGEIRVLKHVTNGELLVPTYSFIKTPRQNNTAQNTDIRYRLPGLNANEYVAILYSASENAMIGEVFSNGAFVEWVFIDLNGTLDYNFHTFIRLGNSLCNLVSKPFNDDTIRYFRNFNVSAINVNGQRYVGVPLASTDSNNAAMAFAVGTVSGGGVVNRLSGFSTTNSLGSTKTDTDGVLVLHQAPYTYDPNNTDALAYCDTNVTIGMVYDGSNIKYMTWGPIIDGTVSLVFKLYYTRNNPYSSWDFKPVEYYQIDFTNKRVFARPEQVNQRCTVINDPTDDKLTKIVKSEFARGSYFNEGHWYASWVGYGMLNDGRRYMINWQVASSTVIHLFTPDTIDPKNAVNSLRFLNAGYNVHSCITAPPTPVRSSMTGGIIYGCFIQTDGISITPDYTTKTPAYQLLLGKPTDASYRLMKDNFGYNAPIKGYTLNNKRGFAPDHGNDTYRAFTFTNGDSIGYHNAVWFNSSRGFSVDDTYDFAFRYNTDLSLSKERYKISPACFAEVQRLALATPTPPSSEWTQTFQWWWAFVPPYPGIFNKGFIRVHYAYKKSVDTSVDIRGYQTTSAFVYYIWVDCITATDALGDVTITHVSNPNVQKSPVDAVPDFGFRGGYSGRAEVLVSGHGVFASLGGKIYTLHTVGPWSGGADAYWPSDLQSKSLSQHRRIRFNIDYTLELDTSNPASNPEDWYCATYTKDLGIGVVGAFLGLGAFYGFRPLDLNTMQYKTGADVVICSARPPAGFTFTVSAPINCLIDGKIRDIPIGSYDLNSIDPNPANKTFYLSAVVDGDHAKLLVENTTPPESRSDRIYIGYLTTSDHDITEINTRPITQWANIRPSVNKIGSSIQTKIGFPGDFV